MEQVLIRIARLYAAYKHLEPGDPVRLAILQQAGELAFGTFMLAEEASMFIAAAEATVSAQEVVADTIHEDVFEETPDNIIVFKPVKD